MRTFGEYHVGGHEQRHGAIGLDTEVLGMVDRVDVECPGDRGDWLREGSDGVRLGYTWWQREKHAPSTGRECRSP